MVSKSWAPLEPRQLGQPLVAILMCTFNGEQFLQEQLESIASQTHKNWVLWISDDGSSDQTWSILHSVQRAWGSERIILSQGPRQGFARNFLSLACRSDIEAEYFAFSDQDDIWLPDKLSRALSMLEGQPDNQALLYGSRTRMVDANGEDLGISKLQPKTLTFSNALVQNVAGGNTMMFNRVLIETIRFAGPQVNIVSHDWWLYLVTTATHGKMIFDQTPYILYRQHKGNVVGSNLGIKPGLKRLRQLFSGRFKGWIQSNCACLRQIESKMSADHVKRVRLLSSLHRLWMLKRLTSFLRSGVRRQSIAGNIALFAAVVLNQV